MVGAIHESPLRAVFCKRRRPQCFKGAFLGTDAEIFSEKSHGLCCATFHLLDKSENVAAFSAPQALEISEGGKA